MQTQQQHIEASPTFIWYSALWTAVISSHYFLSGGPYNSGAIVASWTGYGFGSSSSALTGAASGSASSGFFSSSALSAGGFSTGYSSDIFCEIIKEIIKYKLYNNI